MAQENDIIKKAEASIDQKVKPADKEAYNKIVIAGMKVMFSKEMNGELLDGLRQSQDPAITAAEGIIGILGLLYKQSRNTMPIVPMMMAGMSLLLQGLEFAEQAGIMQVTPQTIDVATQHYIESLLTKLGITQEKLGGMLEKIGPMVQQSGQTAQGA
ncbi:MAG: hypothetical protein V4772_08700 [Pseudomonadota bacterium]